MLRFLAHTQLYTHTWHESSELVAEAATYTTHDKHKRRTIVPLGGFEPSISSIKRLQYQTLDRTVTETGSLNTCLEICLVGRLTDSVNQIHSTGIQGTYLQSDIVSSR